MVKLSVFQRGLLSNALETRLRPSPPSDPRVDQSAGDSPGHRSTSRTAVGVSRPSHRCPRYGTLGDLAADGDAPGAKWYRGSHSYLVRCLSRLRLVLRRPVQAGTGLFATGWCVEHEGGRALGAVP